MRLSTTRQATPDEADGILESMATRSRARAEIRASLAKHITPDRIATLIATLPEDAQRRVIGKHLTEPAVRLTVRIITRKPRP